jgi:hypothetical protein
MYFSKVKEWWSEDDLRILEHEERRPAKKFVQAQGDPA